MKKLLLLTLPLILSAEPPTLNIIADRYFSPYAGAEDILTLSAGVQYAENWVVKKSTPPKKGWIPSLERAGELILFWEPYNYLSMVTQHEVFGHGFRVRTFHSEGGKVKKYTFKTPPPYGLGGAATHFRLKSSKITPFQYNSIISGGVEATSILALRLKLQWLQTGYVNSAQASLYNYAQQDLTNYILASQSRISFFGANEAEGDIQVYVDILNDSLPKGHLTEQDLKKRLWLNYADPFTYYALGAWWMYLIWGEQLKIPMIPIGSYGYLPGLRFGLTPFGPEYYLENFLVHEKKPIYFYLRGSEFAGLRSYGFGIEHAYLWTVGDTPWGFRLDAWLQPDVPYKANSSNNLNTFDYQHQAHYKNRFGLALSVIGHIKMTKASSIFFQAGGKTTGFLPGETLCPSAIIRLGFSFF